MNAAIGLILFIGEIFMSLDSVLLLVFIFATCLATFLPSCICLTNFLPLYFAYSLSYEPQFPTYRFALLTFLSVFFLSCFPSHLFALITCLATFRPICLPSYLFTCFLCLSCFPAFLISCLSVFTSVCLPAYGFFFCLLVCLSFSLLTWLSVWVPIYLPTYKSAPLSCQSVCLFSSQLIC